MPKRPPANTYRSGWVSSCPELHVMGWLTSTVLSMPDQEPCTRHTHPTKRARAVLGLLSLTARPCSNPGRQHCATGGIEFPVAQLGSQIGQDMLTLTALIVVRQDWVPDKSKQASRSSNHPKVGLKEFQSTAASGSSSRRAAAECKQRQHAL